MVDGKGGMRPQQSWPTMSEAAAMMANASAAPVNGLNGLGPMPSHVPGRGPELPQHPPPELYGDLLPKGSQSETPSTATGSTSDSSDDASKVTAAAAQPVQSVATEVAKAVEIQPAQTDAGGVLKMRLDSNQPDPAHASRWADTEFEKMNGKEKIYIESRVGAMVVLVTTWADLCLHSALQATSREVIFKTVVTVAGDESTMGDAALQATESVVRGTQRFQRCVSAWQAILRLQANNSVCLLQPNAGHLRMVAHHRMINCCQKKHTQSTGHIDFIVAQIKF